MRRPWVFVIALLILTAALAVGAPRRAAAETQASGTAFVVHPDGLLLTCYHVVKDSAKIRVTVRGKTYPAILVGKDEKRDLAVLQINASNLPFLPWVDSHHVELGEEVRAFGFPLATELGDTLKVTRGTISGVEQEGGEPVFQVDSVVNPGNSGGPLLNERGQVVGVVVARFVEATSFGYVVPVTAATPLFRGVAPEAAKRSETKLEGPALVRAVAPSIARVTAVPLAETGALPAPFARAFPSSRPTSPVVPEKQIAANPLIPANPETPAGSASKPPATSTVAEPQLFPTGSKVDPPKPAVGLKEGPSTPGFPTTPAAPSTGAVPIAGKVKTPNTNGTTQAPTPMGSPAGNSAVGAKEPTAAVPNASSPKGVEPKSGDSRTVDPKVMEPKEASKAAEPKGAEPKEATVKPAVAPNKPGTPDAAAEKAAADVDMALCRIRATDPPDFPQPVAETVVSDEEKSEWSIANPNAYRLTIYLRGPERRSVIVEPGKTEKIMLPPGKYEVAAELAVDNVTPFYGTQEFGKGTRYKSRFRVEF